MRTLTSCFLLAALTAAPLAQDTESRPAAAVDQLIEQLGDPSYEVRQAAENALSQMGGDALAAVQTAAREHTDPEVRFRAERLSEKLGDDGQPEDTLGQQFPHRQRLGHLDDMFGTLFGQLERDFGLDVPSRRFFHGDFFGDLHEQMIEMGRRAQSSMKGHGENITLSHSFRMNSGSEGVRIEIEETDENGQTQTRSYLAPDIVTFRERYPQVARDYLDQDAERFSFRLDPGWSSDGQPHLRTPEATGPVLGVRVSPIGEQLGGFLGIRNGHGLVVEAVGRGSLAARLGIQPNDVLLTVERKHVGTTDDVRAALREAGEMVQVSVNRKGELRRLEASFDQSPSASPPGISPR